MVAQIVVGTTVTVEIVRREGAGRRQVNSRPETGSLRPMAIETRPFLDAERHKFSREFPAGTFVKPFLTSD
jgi:hypothetical protein